MADHTLEQEPIAFKQESSLKKRFFSTLAVLFVLGLAFVWFYGRQAHFLNQHIESVSDDLLIPLKPIHFSAPIEKEWKEHVFHSRTNYQVIGEELRASSAGSSSMIYQEVNIAPKERPFLTWEWKAIEFPTNKTGNHLADKSNNDFIGRVYAIFKGKTPFHSNVIQYVWDDKFPEGSVDESPFMRNVKIMVVQNGKTGDWVKETRDVISDYKKLFGHWPTTLSAIAIMSDSDNTQTKSEILYRNLSIQKPDWNKKPPSS